VTAQHRDAEHAAARPGLMPDMPAPAPGDVDPSDVVHAYLARNATAIRRAHDAALLDEPDAVHQLRVGLRRLRSALRSFRTLTVRSSADRLRTELAWLGGELGPFREAEVQVARFAACSSPGTAAAMALFAETFHARLSAARTAMAVALDSSRCGDLLDAIADVRRHTRTTAAPPEILARCVAKDWQTLRRRASKVLLAERGDPAPDLEWHATRIAAKRARYAIDAVAPAFAGQATVLAKRMSELTDTLGEHQDAAQAAELTARLATEPAGDEAIIALGVVHGIERDRVSMARRDFAGLWPAIDTPELTSWFSR